MPLDVEIDPELVADLERLARVDRPTVDAVLAAVRLLQARASARALSRAGVRLVRVEVDELPSLGYHRLGRAGGRILVVREEPTRLLVLHLL